MARFLILLGLLSLLILPATARADEGQVNEPAPAATPVFCGCDPVPVCDDTLIQPDASADCVPDPGPRPEGGALVYDRIYGESDCANDTIEVTIVTSRVDGYYVGADNRWYPITEEVDRTNTVQPMTDDEVAIECGQLLVPDSTDPVIEPISSAEQPTAQAESNPVYVVALPNTGSGDSGYPLWPIMAGGAIACIALTIYLSWDRRRK